MIHRIAKGISVTSATSGYIKLSTAKLPRHFEHPAILRSPDGRPIGLFFFFDAASTPSRDVARRAAQEAASTLRPLTESPILASIHEWSAKRGLETDGLWTSSRAGDRDAA